MDAQIFKQIIDRSNIPTLVYDGNTITYTNKALDSLLLTLKSDSSSFYKLFLEDSHKQTVDFTIKSKRVYFNITRQNHNNHFTVIQLIDVTEQQAHLINLENTIHSLHEIDKHRNQFLENLSHELRTPLTGIIGFTDLLKHTDLNEEALLYIENLSESAGRMVETLNNINDFSMLITENIPVQYDEVELFSLLKNICDSYYYKAKSKNISIRLSGEISSNTDLVSDAKKIENIVKQLLSNAVKFTENGKIDVYYKIDIDNCIISVADTGIGILPDKIDLCFEDFKQISEGYNRHYEGSGIGLSIVKKLVNLLNGHIDVKSDLGKGSIFTVTLPNHKKSHKYPIIKESIPSKRGNNILYIEDNYLNQKLLQISLGKKFNITIADNAEKGLQLMKEKNFNLVLMDINLGRGMDGIQAMKIIKNDQKTSKIPVIALTAYALANDEENFIKEGFDDYIPKPYTKEEITQKILKYIHV